MRCPAVQMMRYTCKSTIQPVELNNTNGCRLDRACGGNKGAVCRTPENANVCSCAVASGNFKFCAFSTAASGSLSGGGGLCYETCCDR